MSVPEEVKKQIVAEILIHDTAETQSAMTTHQVMMQTAIRKIVAAETPSEMEQWVKTSTKLSGESLAQFAERKLELYRTLVQVYNS